jgi:hypothetical protein
MQKTANIPTKATALGSSFRRLTTAVSLSSARYPYTARPTQVLIMSNQRSRVNGLLSSTSISTEPHWMETLVNESPVTSRSSTTADSRVVS